MGNNPDDAQIGMQTWQGDFWVVGKMVSNISLCSPENWGKIPILTSMIFQKRGWFNHQLEILCVSAVICTGFLVGKHGNVFFITFGSRMQLENENFRVNTPEN